MKSRAVMFLLAALFAMVFAIVRRPTNQDGRPIAEAEPTPAARIEDQMRAALQVPAETAGRAPAPVIPEPQLAPKLELQRGKLPWEEKIERVTGDASLSETGKARQLLAMIPALPEHGLTTAAEEAVKRVPDADYNALALPLVANPQTHGLVEGVLFADLMERPDTITLPALLRIAQTPNHSYAKYARDNLDLLLGEDFGTDWAKWDAAIRKALGAGK